jgi:hypothetical protein
MGQQAIVNKAAFDIGQIADRLAQGYSGGFFARLLG